jgi:hypothetical protein
VVSRRARDRCPAGAGVVVARSELEVGSWRSGVVACSAKPARPAAPSPCGRFRR